jgi:hypothetical protein
VFGPKWQNVIRNHLKTPFPPHLSAPPCSSDDCNLAMPNPGFPFSPSPPPSIVLATHKHRTLNPKFYSSPLSPRCVVSSPDMVRTLPHLTSSHHLWLLTLVFFGGRPPSPHMRLVAQTLHAACCIASDSRPPNLRPSEHLGLTQLGRQVHFWFLLVFLGFPFSFFLFSVLVFVSHSGLLDDIHNFLDLKICLNLKNAHILKNV